MGVSYANGSRHPSRVKMMNYVTRAPEHVERAAGQFVVKPDCLALEVHDFISVACQYAHWTGKLAVTAR